MITTKNYYSEIKSIGVTNLPDTLKKSHELVDKVTHSGNDWSKYKSNETIKRVIDLYIDKLNEFASKKKPSAEKKTEVMPAPKTNVVKAPKAAKPAKEEQQSNTTLVERISDEVTLIKRYIHFHGKQRTKEQVINLLKAVQKAILERRVSKTSMYSTEIMQIQDSLISLAKDKAEAFQIIIGDASLAHYTQIVNGVAPMTSISLLKRYISLLGKRDIKEKVKSLQAHFQRAFDKNIVTKKDKYFTQYDYAFENMKMYMKGKAEVLAIREAELNGFKGLGFIPSMIAAAAGAFMQHHTHKALHKSLNGTETEVMSVDDTKAAEFQPIGFTGDLLKLIGNACAPTSIFLYGKGGSGKSSLALKIADFLHSQNRKTLYIAGEQYNTPSFKELIIQTKIKGGENFKIVPDINTLPISDFDVVVIDSKDSIGLKSSAEFKSLRDAYPDKIWIITSHGLKSKSWKGDGQWENECEVMIYCENGKASTFEQKNRWGGKAEIQLF